MTVFAQKEHWLLGEEVQALGYSHQSASIQLNLGQFPLQVRCPGRDIAFPIHNQPDHRPLDFQEGDAIGQMKKGHSFLLCNGRCIVGHSAAHSNRRDPGLTQTLHHPVQPHPGIQLAKVLHINQHQFVACQIREGRGTGAQTARPTDRAAQIFCPYENPGLLGQSQSIDIFQCSRVTKHKAVSDAKHFYN